MSDAIWHPFTQLKDFQPLGEVVRAQGAWLELADGRRVMDGIASWWVNVHGHGHPDIVGAIGRQAASCDHVILADFTHAPARQLTRELIRILPDGLDHVFFSDDGSTAVEVALKMAWQARRIDDPRRTRFVAFEGGYHGDTLGAMSVGARDVFTAPFDDLLRDTTFLPWGDADAAERFFRDEGHEVVACIIEPMVQGAGGLRFAEPEFLTRLDAAVHQAGALWIADEVMTGFGRTGTMWACDQAGVTPDLMAMSKGITGGTLPLGVTAVRSDWFERFLGPDKCSAFLHGHSYCGNPIACAAALASIALFERESTLARVRQMSSIYLDHIDLFASVPNVTQVRTMGGIFACNVVGGPEGYLDPVGRRIQTEAMSRGLYVRPLGNVVYLMPPFCVSEDELRWALQALYESMQAVLG